MEVQRLRHGTLRRPRIVRAPGVASALEDRGLGLCECALVLQIIGEEWCLDLLSVVLAGRRTEIDVAELLSGAIAPATVPPRADDEKVAILPIVLFECPVNGDRPVEVLLIPPAGDVERRDGDSCEIRTHGLPLPELIVIGVRGDVRPRRIPFVLPG